MYVPRHTMTSGDVARVLGLSRDRVLQLDGELAPVRVGAMKARRYDPAVIERVARRRARDVRGVQ